jgi:hypothetical protein
MIFKTVQDWQYLLLHTDQKYGYWQRITEEEQKLLKFVF